MAIRPVLPSKGRKLSALRMKTFSRLNTQPARTPVNASTTLLRVSPHDSEPMWLARPSSYETFIHTPPPAFAGAPVPVSGSTIHPRYAAITMGVAILDHRIETAIAVRLPHFSRPAVRAP